MNKFVGHRVILRNGKVTDTKVEIDDEGYPLYAMVNHKKYRWSRNGTYCHIMGESEWDLVDIYAEYIPLVHCGGPYVTREAYDRVVTELAELKRKIRDLLT